MVLKSLSSALLLAALQGENVLAFPTLLVNSCARSLRVGAVIMGEAVQSSTNAPANQGHSVSASNPAGSAVCGGSVTQGEKLTIQVDPDLANKVGVSGWSMGVGPNYIVEAANGIVMKNRDNDAVGCDSSRIVNPGANITVYAIEPGSMVVRMLAAYAFGQVWASEECVVNVTGTRTVTRASGHLVDNANLASNPDLLALPYTLSVQQLKDGAASGYSIVLPSDSDDGASSIAIDEATTNKVTELLNTLEANMTDIQVSVVGFQKEGDAPTVQVVLLTWCANPETCPDFLSKPTDRVCISTGLCIESSVVDETAGTITTTIVSDDDSWFGIGFSTPGGGMTAGGSGSDMFVCSSEGLRRFTTVVRDNPGTSALNSQVINQDSENSATIQNICVLDDDSGSGRMTFTRPLDDFRPIVPGQAQAIIWARGPGEQALSSRHRSRGEVMLDLTNVSGGASTTKAEAPWILWCHIVMMSLSWGFCLPLAVVIASRTRNVEGGRPGAWFSYHKALARIGWTFQTLGALFAVYYCEVYSDHMQYNHTKYGAFIIVAGFLQPISALLRPHPPKNAWPSGKPSLPRLVFEIYHKGVGWFAMVFGVVNVCLGAKLVDDLGFEDSTYNVPIAFVSITVGIFGIYFILFTINPNNFLAKAMTAAA